MDDLSKLILDELRDIRKDVQNAREEIAALKVKASIWGALGGLLAGLGAWFVGTK